MSVSNFTGDVEAMLRMGEHFGLNDRDFRFLTHCLRACIRPADNQEGAVVSLSDRQWNLFRGVRRKFHQYYRHPSHFIAYLKAIRAADAQSSTAASTNQN